MRGLGLGLLAALLPALAWAQAAVPPPAEYAARDLYIRFERDGYRGGAYLNADHTYVIVQTGPDGATTAFKGAWRERGTTGFCIAPDEGSGGKCFESMPTEVGRAATIVSDKGERYRLTLVGGR